jgi:hypothetical protein
MHYTLNLFINRDELLPIGYETDFSENHQKTDDLPTEEKSFNDIEEKELQSYSEAMSDYQIELHYVSGMDQSTISNLSDGSEES